MTRSERLTREHIEIHRFAGSVLGRPLPSLHHVFSPIIHATERTERLLKAQLGDQFRSDSCLSMPVPRTRDRMRSRQPIKDAGRKLSHEPRKNSRVEKDKSSQAPHAVNSLTPGLESTQRKTTEKKQNEKTKTLDTQKCKKSRSSVLLSPRFQPPLSSKASSKVHTLSTVTILSPVFKGSKKCHHKSKSELHTMWQKNVQSINSHNDSNASESLAPGTEEMLTALYQESAHRLQLYAKHSSRQRAKKLQEVNHAISRITKYTLFH